MLPVAAALALLAAAPAAFDKYQEESETVCVGNPEHAFAEADSWSAAGHKFILKGARAEVRRDGADAAAIKGEARLGLLAAVKDFTPETQANLKAFVDAFKRAGVSGLIIDGDSAYGVDDQDTTLTEMFTFLGAQGLPVYAVIGNSESRSSFNRAVLAAYRKYPNVINLDLVRRVDGDGFTILSMPGYYDRRYIHESSGCFYKPEDVQALLGLAKDPGGPIVLVSHGPPRQHGKFALDATNDGQNVGDPELASVMAQAKIPFGVFGHILESGGRATDLAGKKQVKPNSPAAELFVNPGPAFADPWQLNSGAVSHGMAAILTIRGAKAEWQSLTPTASKVKGRSVIRVLWR
jgi:Icc-related predicted phosphoesterase